MTIADARELLRIHSFTHPDIRNPKIENGFLGSLRPYKGQLVEAGFHEVMAALRILAPSLQLPTVDREVVDALWSICHLARSWGVHPDGMLRRNGLITQQDTERLESWVECISYATMILLGGGEVDEAFAEYDLMITSPRTAAETAVASRLQTVSMVADPEAPGILSTHPLDSLDWHDLPVESVTITEHGLTLAVKPYNETTDDYDLRVLRITDAESLELGVTGVLSAKDLRDVEVTTFSYAPASSGRMSGTIEFLPGNAGYWTISFTNAAWALDDV